MYKYKIVYKCSDGYEGIEYIYAVNRMMAFEAFKAFGYENVVNVDCFRVLDEDKEDEE
jgi:hypothetical protein